MNTKTTLVRATHLTFSYAGRGIALAAVALCLSLTGCDDDVDGPITDAAVDSSPDTIVGDAKPTDTNVTTDGGRDSATADAKAPDASADTAVADTSADTALL